MAWSRRERRWWFASLAFLVLIYASLYFVRAPVEYLRERNLLRLAVIATFAAACVPLVLFLRRRRVGRREVLVLLIAGLALAGAVSLAGLPEERLHFVEYGLLGAMLFFATQARAERQQVAGFAAVAKPAATAAVLAALAGWGDEGIQAILPNRFYDIRDVLWNVLGSGIVILALAALELAHRSDRPG